jgi:hypothetical protein
MMYFLGFVAIIFFFGIIIRSWVENRKEKKERERAMAQHDYDDIDSENKKPSEQESMQSIFDQVYQYEKIEYENWFTDFKPIMEESISAQKSAIKKADLDHLVKWYESLLKEANKQIQMHKQFSNYYNDINKLQKMFDKFSDMPIYYDYGSNAAVYLLKLRSSIDNKLYLLVGQTTEDNAEIIFQDNPLVDCEEVLCFEALNENLAKSLVSMLIDNYGPQKTLDEYSQFDGFEQIISMKSWNQVLKTINEVSTNESQLMKRDFYTRQCNLKDLHEEVKNFSFNNDGTFYFIQDTYSRLDFLKLLHDKYYLPQSSLLKNNRFEIQSDLIDMSNMGHDKWKDHIIKIMEKDIKDLYSYDFKRDGVLSEIYLNYFDNDYPLSVGFSYDDDNTNLFNYTKLKDHSKDKPKPLSSIQYKSEYL